MSLQEHVDRHAILGFEKQLHADDVIGDAAWMVDLDAGKIVFDGELEMDAALLGTETGETFLPVVEVGRELSLAHAGLDEVALLACGILGLDATYSGAVDEEVRVLLSLRHPSLALPEPDVARMITVLSTVLQSGCVADWPAALAAYGEQRDLTFVAGEGRYFVGGVTVTLDDLGRVAEISA